MLRHCKRDLALENEDRSLHIHDKRHPHPFRDYRYVLFPCTELLGSFRQIYSKCDCIIDAPGHEEAIEERYGPSVQCIIRLSWIIAPPLSPFQTSSRTDLRFQQ